MNSYHFFCVMSENNLTSKKYVCIMTKVRKRTNLQYIAEGREGSMEEADEKLKEMHMGRIIHMLSHQMKRNCNNVDSAMI